MNREADHRKLVRKRAVAIGLDGVNFVLESAAGSLCLIAHARSCTRAPPTPSPAASWPPSSSAPGAADARRCRSNDDARSRVVVLGACARHSFSRAALFRRNSCCAGSVVSFHGERTSGTSGVRMNCERGRVGYFACRYCPASRGPKSLARSAGTDAAYYVHPVTGNGRLVGARGLVGEGLSTRLGGVGTHLGSRKRYYLSLKGPAIAFVTGCSSLVALHLAWPGSARLGCSGRCC